VGSAQISEVALSQSGVIRLAATNRPDTAGVAAIHVAYLQVSRMLNVHHGRVRGAWTWGSILRPGRQSCALYSGSAERDDLLFSFLREGLRGGDTCLC